MQSKKRDRVRSPRGRRERESEREIGAAEENGDERADMKHSGRRWRRAAGDKDAAAKNEDPAAEYEDPAAEYEDPAAEYEDQRPNMKTSGRT